MPVALTPEARYDSMMTAFGGDGYYCTTHTELHDSLTTALSKQKPCLINVIINPMAARKPQEFTWLTGSKL